MPKQHDDNANFHENTDELVDTRHDGKMLKCQQAQQISDDRQNIFESQFLMGLRIGFAESR